MPPAPHRRPRAPVLLALLALLAGALAPAGAAAAPPRPLLGVNAGGPVNGDWDSARHLAKLRRIADAGMEAIRVDLPWIHAEPTAPAGGAHAYDWWVADRLMRHAALAGLTPHVVLGGAPAWANGGAAFTVAPEPAHEAGLVAYVAAFAGRYGAGGTYWAAHPELDAPRVLYQLWNEPNLDAATGWTPERLADVYLAARAALRAHDPAGTLAIAGFSQTEDTDRDAGAWLARAVAHRPELAARIDAVGVHVYATSQSAPWLWFGIPQPSAEDRLAEARADMTRLGIAAPIDVDEIGWSTTGLESGWWPTVDEATRTHNMRRLAADWTRSDCGVRAILPYSWNTDDPAVDPAGAASGRTSPEPGFTLQRADGSFTDAGRAWSDGVVAARSAGQADRPTHVVCETAGAATAAVPADAATPAVPAALPDAAPDARPSAPGAAAPAGARPARGETPAGRGAPGATTGRAGVRVTGTRIRARSAAVRLSCARALCRARVRVAGRGRTVSLRRGAPRWVRVAVPRRGRAATLVVSAGGAAIGRYALPRR